MPSTYRKLLHFNGQQTALVNANPSNVQEHLRVDINNMPEEPELEEPEPVPSAS